MMFQKLTQTYKISSYQGDGCHNSASRDLILWFLRLGRTFNRKYYFHIQNAYTPCIFKMEAAGFSEKSLQISQNTQSRRT